jgi:hypothetical protein
MGLVQTGQRDPCRAPHLNKTSENKLIDYTEYIHINDICFDSAWLSLPTNFFFFAVYYCNMCPNQRGNLVLNLSYIDIVMTT